MHKHYLVVLFFFSLTGGCSESTNGNFIGGRSINCEEGRESLDARCLEVSKPAEPKNKVVRIIGECNQPSIEEIEAGAIKTEHRGLRWDKSVRYKLGESVYEVPIGHTILWFTPGRKEILENLHIHSDTPRFSLSEFSFWWPELRHPEVNWGTRPFRRPCESGRPQPSNGQHLVTAWVGIRASEHFAKDIPTRRINQIVSNRPEFIEKLTFNSKLGLFEYIFGGNNRRREYYRPEHTGMQVLVKCGAIDAIQPQSLGFFNLKKPPRQCLYFIKMAVDNSTRRGCKKAYQPLVIGDFILGSWI